MEKTWANTLDHNDRNCFDLLRLFFAAAVVVYHSFYLAPGADREDIAFRFLAGEYGVGVGSSRIDLGTLAVLGFFVISGYLIARSASESSCPTYATKRFLRIAPAFILVSLIGLFVIGPIAWGGVGSYFEHQRWAGLIANVAAFKSASPSDIFMNNPESLLNGSLWSIRYEIDCYIIIGFVVATFGRMARPVTAALFLLFVGTGIAADHHVLSLPIIDHGALSLAISSPNLWPSLFPFFLAGSLFFQLRTRIPRSTTLFVVAAAIVVAGVNLSVFRPLLPIGFAYVVLFSASALSWSLKVKGRRTDLSYGMYIYAWPIQQGLVTWAFVSSPWLLMITTLVLLVPISYASWMFIEGPAQRLKYSAPSSRYSRLGGYRK